MPKKLSYRIDLYDLIFYNNTKSYRKCVSTYLFRIYNKLGNKGRYIDQYEVPFHDIDGVITYIYQKYPHLMDDKDTLIAKLFDEIKFEYYCVLSAIKTRKLLCDDMKDVEAAFIGLVEPSIKDFSRNEVVIAKKMLTSINVDELIDKYKAKYENEDVEVTDEQDTFDWDEDDKKKCITYEQLEMDLSKHLDNGKGHQVSVEDVVRRQTKLENKIIHELKPIKDNQLTCSCGVLYTKANYARHRKSPKHQEWEQSHGGAEG
jgi:hypothetical protein